MRGRTIAIIVGSVAVVGGAAFVFGPGLYADVAGRAAEAPPSLEDDGATALDDTAALDGEWVLGEGSFAGYRVHEVLRGNDVDVTGRTEQVEGTATIDAGSLTAATITVDMASVATDQPPRDAYFRGTALQVGTHPTATFTLTEPVALPDGGTEVVLVGDLMVHGVTQAVQAQAQVGQTADGLEVVGSIPITFSDYGVAAPDLSFVRVDEEGAVEFALAWERG